MIGGGTLRVDNRSARAYVLLAPSPLDSGFRPEKSDSGARPLLLTFSHRVDPSRLRSGRPITVIGRVRGERQSFPKEVERPPRHVAIDVLEEHLLGSGSDLINGEAPFPTPAPGAGIPFIPY
jgi:starvation-inducible outer membrane lipoprotein